jgi:hypothetical protein
METSKRRDETRREREVGHGRPNFNKKNMALPWSASRVIHVIRAVPKTFISGAGSNERLGVSPRFNQYCRGRGVIRPLHTRD